MARKDCVFCRMLQGTEKHYLVGENEHAIAILDINPFTQGHTLIIPRRHAHFWNDLTVEELSGLFALAKEVADRLQTRFKPDFVALFARGRRVPHAHIFLVPTFKDDPQDQFFNAMGSFQEAPPQLMKLRTPEALEATAKKLRVP